VRWAVNEHFGMEFLTFAPCEGNRLQDLLAINGAWHIAKEEPSWTL